MCGISGIVSNAADSLQANLDSMVSAQRHRGPDETDYYLDDQCLLGHNRLSIVDISLGQQPMKSFDERYIIVFNGEIYGYKDLRSALDYPFRTKSDTEVILAMYLTYGEKMLDLLPGMFAFAIWDRQKRELFFARDRVGEKPFYYSGTPGGDFVFASELPAMVASGMIDLQLSDESISHYLSKSYVSPARSIYKNIQSLPPGHCGLYHEGHLTIKQYWNPPMERDPISMSDAVDELEHLLKLSIRSQMIADVPVSVFLSGGLDSSTISALAKMEKPDIQAITYRFKSGLDEGPYAHEVAKMHGIDIVDVWEKDSYDLADLFLRSVRCYGEPFGDSSSIPMMMICREARQHSKVVLTGDGADELFGGYISRYRPAIYAEGLSRSTRLRLLSERLFFGMCNRVRSKESFYYRSLAAKSGLINRNPLQTADYNSSYFKDEELESLGLPRASAGSGPQNDWTNRIMRSDIENSLPGDILVKADRASMYSGLELRAPFLSKEILEFSLRLPSRFKITKERDKIIMREAFGSMWPQSIMKRSKQGFGSPVTKWLSQPRMRELISAHTSSNSKLYSYLDKKTVEKNMKSNGMKAWVILNLAVWLNNHS